MNELQEKIVDIIIKQNTKFQKLLNKENPLEGNSEKGDAIKKIIEKNDFGCAKESVAKLCSCLIEEKIKITSEDKEEIELTPFSIICDNEENMYFVDGNCNLYDLNVDEKDIDELESNSLRPTTTKETKQFVTRIIEKNNFNDLFPELISLYS